MLRDFKYPLRAFGRLLGLVEPGFQARGVDSEEFLDEIAKRLADKLG